MPDRVFLDSYFDSLILASACETGCQTLYSEDLQDGQRIENQLMIVNPFRA
jgi:predicted nucleic acid-binding protein